MATERSDMPEHGVMRQQRHAFARADESPHRQSTTECLAEHKDVRHHDEMFESEEFARSSEARLHFVENEQGTGLVAMLA